MFRFPKTRMLHEAAVTGKAPHHPVVEVLIFLLLFLIASAAQSVILTPVQLFAFFFSDAFVEIIENSNGNYFDTVAAVMDAMSSLPSWVMLVQLFSTVAIIAVCVLYCRLIEKRSLVSLGFVKKGALPEYLAGLGIGFLLFGGAVAICVATGTLTLSAAASPSVGMILLYFIGFLIQGMSEEILCRSYLMVSMSRGCPVWISVLTNALLFAALHLANPGITPLSLLNLTLFGVFASIYTLHRGSIWGISAIHAIWNFTQGNVFGISVSGMSDTPTIFESTSAEGGIAEIINGGAFGLEGGLGVTAVLVLGCVVMMMVKTKRSEIVAATPTA